MTLRLSVSALLLVCPMCSSSQASDAEARRRNAAWILTAMKTGRPDDVNTNLEQSRENPGDADWSTTDETGSSISCFDLSDG